VRKRPGSKPTTVEKPLTPAEFSEMPEPPQSQLKRAWQKPCVVDLPLEPPDAPEFSIGGPGNLHFGCARPPPKRLSFAAMLREDEDDGVLLTELVGQSAWSPTHMQPQPAVH
jgi:hypothetical protein